VIQHRDEKGRITRPSGPAHAVPRARDERSGRPTENPGYFSFRMPVLWRQALEFVAQQRDITLTQVVLDALLPVVQPVLHGENASSAHAPAQVAIPLPSKMPRLVDQLPSDITNAVPEYDHVGRQQQRAEPAPKRRGLVDQRR
jgi:hypothetical protein